MPQANGYLALQPHFLAHAFLAGAFLATTFLAGAFLATAFFAGAFLATAFFTTFFAGAFLATAAFFATFFAIILCILVLFVYLTLPPLAQALACVCEELCNEIFIAGETPLRSENNEKIFPPLKNFLPSDKITKNIFSERWTPQVSFSNTL